MAKGDPRGGGTEKNDVGPLVLGLVVLAAGMWLLAGDVTVGALAIGRSGLFGTIAVVAGALLIIGGIVSLVRSRGRG